MGKDNLYEDVLKIAKFYLGTTNFIIQQLKGGTTNFVYCVNEYCSNNKFVIHTNFVKRKYILEGYIFWNNILKNIEIPIPKIYYYDLSCIKYPPYIIMEHIDGDELLTCYSSLNILELQGIAKEVISIQKKVSTLNKNHGYGAVLSYNDPLYFSSWLENIQDKFNVVRSKKTLQVDKIINNTNKKIIFHENYFENIEPIPFLEEVNYKNLLIKNGHLISILDFDELCFGDILLSIGKTKAGLIKSNLDTIYCQILAKEMNLSSLEIEIVNLYAEIEIITDFLNTDVSDADNLFQMLKLANENI